ncbi:MAG: murein hydrolase activator EnvC family protein [Solirubrobacteraceae bacterium]
MHSLRRPITRLACPALVAVLGVAVLAIAGALSHVSVAHGATVGQLQQRISAGQGQVSGLSGAVSAAAGRLSQLSSSIGRIQSAVAHIQAELDSQRAELLKLRGELITARTRLSHLEAFQAHAQTVLAGQLVNRYESDRPDLIGVVLEARGFPDLLERLAFAQRIEKQDVQVVGQVRSARQAVATQATRLGALQAHEQTITIKVLDQRNRIARVRLSLVQRQLALAKVHAAKAGQLGTARGQVADLQRQLTRMQAAQAAAAAAAAAGAGGGIGAGPAGSSGSSTGAGGSVGAGQVSSGGGFTFPMPKSAASGPGTWTLDQGVDMAAPGGTPLLAVGSGTIVLHGIGGFGPSAPVLHLDSGQYVYYGHAGPGNMLPIGTHVSAGQVISEVGYGIVGFSSGPHLEIGFCDGSGTPLGGGTASQMLALLHGAYGG